MGEVIMLIVNTKIDLSKRNIIKFLTFLFVVSCVLFPADLYGIKKISFALVIFLGINQVIDRIFTRQYRVVLFMGIVFPICTIVHSVILGSSLGNAIGEGYTGVLFLLLIVVYEYDIDYERILLISLKFLCGVIIILALLDLTGISDVNQPTIIRNFIYDNNIGFIGKSVNYAAYYKIYIKTSSLLIILLWYSFNNKKWIDLTASVVALTLSGSRANIIVAFILLIAMFFLYPTSNKIQKIIKIICIIGIIIGFGLLLPKLINVASGMMSTKGSISSDEIRNGQLKGVLESLNNPIKVLFGAGYGNEIIFDYGRSAVSTEIELAYFSLLFKIGLFWFVTYIGFLVVPFLSSIENSMKIMFLGYLVIAYSNPLLYSSTSMIIFVYIFYTIQRRNDDWYNLLGDILKENDYTPKILLTKG